MAAASEYAATAAGLETDEQLTIARALQVVHDMHEPKEWVEELGFVAESNDLNTKVLEEFR